MLFHQTNMFAQQGILFTIIFMKKCQLQGLRLYQGYFQIQLSRHVTYIKLTQFWPKIKIFRHISILFSKMLLARLKIISSLLSEITLSKKACNLHKAHLFFWTKSTLTFYFLQNPFATQMLIGQNSEFYAPCID